MEQGARKRSRLATLAVALAIGWVGTAAAQPRGAKPKKGKVDVAAQKAA